MAMDFIGLSVGMGYTDETVIGGGALKGKNCVVSNIEEVADGVNVTFQWTLDDGTVQTDTAFIPRGTQGEAGVAGKSAYQVWLDEGNTGSEEDFLNSLKGEKGADGTMSFEDLTEEQKESLNGFSPIITPNPDNTDDVYKLDITTEEGTFTTPNLRGGDEVTKYTYEGTGNLSGETYYSYEDLSTKIGETVEVTVSNRYGESQGTLTIVSKISDTELEVDSGAWIDTIMLTNVETTTAELIDDVRTSTTSTWSSEKIANDYSAKEYVAEQLSGYAKISDIDTVNETIKESVCASSTISTSRDSFKVVAELKRPLNTSPGMYFKFNYVADYKLNEVDIVVVSSFGAYYNHSKGDKAPKEISYTLENDTSLSIGIKFTGGISGYKHIECPTGSVTSIKITNTFYTGDTIATSY